MKNLIHCLGFVLLSVCCSNFAWSGDSCITCHEKIQSGTYAGHNYSDWKNSVHAKHGISCASCHGGNSAVSDPVKAHQGVFSSRKEESKVHFKKVSETCGGCHAGEFKEFQKSAHYKILQNTGKGPNCLTCHGAMATSILQHADLDQTCSLCHGKPTSAARTLSLMDSAKKSLDLYQKNLKSGDGKSFEKRYREIQRKWHSFDVSGVSASCEELIQDIRKAERESNKNKGNNK